MRRSKLNLFIVASLITLALPAFALVDPTLDQTQNLLTTQLKNWGLFNSQEKSDIRALDAWKIEEGNRKIIVAVIDTGIDPKHKNLSNNLWHDPLEKQAEVYGWDFVTNKSNPLDLHGHGTHIAGIIGAVTDLDTGVSGVAHKVSIMSVKYYSENSPGTVNLANTVRAINYAINHGAHIINYSGGGPEFSLEEKEAIQRAEAKGILFVAAAGNEHRDTDHKENFYFPSSYRLSNIISVAATDSHNNLLPSSNWGRQNVDVAAPGGDILSTLPRDQKGKEQVGRMSGTSQATAFVTGTAALLLSQNPKLTPQKIREIIMQSVDRIPGLQSKVGSGGRINAYHALLTLTNRGKKPDSAPLIGSKIAAERPFSLHNLFVD